MKNFIIGLILILILIAVPVIQNLPKRRKEEKSKPDNKYYTKKKLLSENELFYYNCFKELDLKYITFPQINLASIIEKHSTNRFRNELFRNIDFCIFDKDLNLLLAIEINDSSHKRYDRILRDKKLRNILNSCNIELLTFNTSYPNTKESIIKRTTETLDNIIENIQ